MASLNNLSFVLSAEDAAVFQRLQSSALLPTLAVPGQGELVKSYKKNKREEERKKVEPHADLLEIKLFAMLEARKESILAQLRETTSTIFKVGLFSWNTVHYPETLTELKRRVSEMTPLERADWEGKRHLQEAIIHGSRLESKFGVEYRHSEDDWRGEEYTYWMHHPMKVDRIFRNSDLAMRLSLALGPNFFPSYSWEDITPPSLSADGIRVYNKTLNVTYFPFGVSKAQMTKLVAVAKRDQERAAHYEKVTYLYREFAVGHEDLCVIPPPQEEHSSE
jgi:hypothetical protein